ncbi:MAG: NUDIX domain-containing protein [Sphaerimonospora mesophila]
MPYVDSYIWKIRQKIGHDLLIIPSVDIVAVREDGKLLLVFNRDANAWVFPGGYAEEGTTSPECAARELLEETGLEAAPDDLIPFAFVSGYVHRYSNGDVTQPFRQVFMVNRWRDAGGMDEDEISGRRWFSPEELAQINTRSDQSHILAALRTYQTTGTYQMITLRELG